MTTLKVITVAHHEGKNKVTQRPFNIYRVGGIMQTARGEEYVEVVVDASESPKPESGKTYQMELELYPTQEKKLAVACRALRPVAVASAKAA